MDRIEQIKREYDVKELRETVEIDPEEKIEIPNYKCKSCGNIKHVDDHKRCTPNWCESCESVQKFIQFQLDE